jgi:endonuclease-3
METESRTDKSKRLRKILATLRKTYPDARLELDFSSPLELLIALILAAQARDDSVNAITAKLFSQYQTAADWADEDEETLQGHLRKINFYRNKTRSIQKACRVLVEKFGGQVPNDCESLMTLPGVGRKTANVLLGNAFAQDVIGVDTHVARLSGRLGFSTQQDPDDVEADLALIVPSGESVAFCHLMQFHGRRICTAKSPDCPNCPINKLCPWPEKPD